MQRNSRQVYAYVLLAYAVQGLCEHFCLPAQPLENYFLKSCNWNAAQISAYLALLMVPWTLKPIYGIVTDLVLPLPKQTYLAITFLIAAIGYTVCFVAQPLMFQGLLLAGCGLSWGTALLLGLVVESFDAEHAKSVFSRQAVTYYLACMAASTIGGLLCQHLPPAAALAVAFATAAIGCGMASLVSGRFLVTPRQTISERHSRLSLKEAFLNRRILLLAAFVWFWNFSPGIGVPLYFHYTNVLHLPQALIGQLNACNCLGMLLGAAAFPLMRGSLSKQLYFCIALSILTTLSFSAITDGTTAATAEIARGVANMFGILMIYTMVAGVSKPGLETIISSAILAIYNLSTQTSMSLGGYLYSHIFDNRLTPLLITSSLCTAACALLVRSVVSSRTEKVRSQNKLIPVEK